MARRIAAVLTALVAAAALAAPAQATFPGRNGDIYWTEALPGDTLAFHLLRQLDPVTGEDVNLWGCGLGVFPDVPCSDGTSAAASPNGEIAFITVLRVGDPVDDSATLRVFDRSGNQREVDLPNSALYDTDRDGRRLSFLNDGSTLAAQTYAPNSTAPYRRLRLDGTLGPQLAPTGAQWLDWSIDGRAAYVYRGNVFALGRHGPARQLTFGGGDAPSWSPHGTSIAFVRNHDLYVVRSHGGPARRLTTQADWPAWSPDGTKIAFVRAGSIWVLDLRTGQAKDVLAPEFPATGPYYATPPVWQALPR